MDQHFLPLPQGASEYGGRLVLLPPLKCEGKGDGKMTPPPACQVISILLSGETLTKEWWLLLLENNSGGSALLLLENKGTIKQ